MKYYLGVDTGTTSISIAVMSENELAESRTINHASFLPEEFPGSRQQNPERITHIVLGLIDDITSRLGQPSAIGFTGQMHGILYVDGHGEAASPLYTWQDMSGTLPVDGTKNSLELLREHGVNLSAGYGIGTHYYLQKSGKIPPNAAKLSTISDYIAMKLCGKNAPLLSPDMSASWGGFDVAGGAFRYDALEGAGVDTSYLPEVLRGYQVVGHTKSGVPVVCSMGDNQASIMGAVNDPENSLLLNVGTGSQVSFVSSEYVDVEGDIETRPYGEKYVLVGAGLCGGRAYAMLEKFYREISGTECYSLMKEHAEKFMNSRGVSEAWNVDTRFSGTRSRPDITGSITGITEENFCPGALTVGVIRGILQELHAMYEDMTRLTGRHAKILVGSGNGIRKNELMQRLAADMFGMKIYIPEHKEEAACGAALCAMEMSGAA